MRRGAAALLAFVVGIGSGARGRAEPPGDGLRLYADLDDDDDDGIADGQGGELSKRSLADVHWLAPRGQTALVRGVSGDAVRVIVGRRALAGADLGGAPRRDVGLEGVRAGRSEVSLGGRTLTVDVVEVRALDGADGVVDLVRSHASISRNLPAFLGTGAADTDALRWVFIGAPDALPDAVRVSSTRPDSSKLDEIATVALAAHPCPAGVSGEFVSAAPRR